MALNRQRCRALWASAAGLLIFLALFSPAPARAASSRELAAERYRYARLLFEDLQSVPAPELGEEQYLLVIDAFKKVHRTSPASSYCDDALLKAADLYREMIGRFGPKIYEKKAIAAYQFLINEYPYSKLLDRARQSIDEIGKGIPPSGPSPDLPDREEEEDTPTVSEAAPAAPPSTRAGEAPGSEATEGTEAPATELVANDDGSPVVAMLSSRSQAIPVSEKPNPSQRRSKLGSLDGVRFWTNPDYTRVVIELDDRVEISYDQLPAPKRLFFNLMETRLGADLEQESSFEVGDSFLKRIRVAQFDHRSTRVVFDLERAVFFDVVWLSNPARLVVEVRETDAPAVLTQSAPPTPPAPAAEGSELAGKAPSSARPAATSADPSFAQALDQEVTTPPAAEPATTAPAKQVPAREPAEEAPVEVAKVTPPPPAPPLDNLPAPKPATANAKGERSLIRALGLKVGRVVIDAGHGGHDPGSLGPTGLQEKDVVLDVALRLGKLIADGLGGEVSYTRDDDRFIGVKERTKLANDHKADLLISIHANASPSRNVRGIETYYLNFTTDSWALTVASRENAASDRSVHELQDLLSKIALKERIEESQEFAARIQTALHTGLSEDTKNLRDRGVRKAPLLVLIGAKMPAILAEIGFISNPHTEKLMKTGAYRQKIANHLYQGVLSYAEGLGSISMARSDSSVE